eukprot:TRINITY_DN80303_c0_g1_i1.p1 TRINITY_DN80303_c0_g1~~TRINITY_DN80303_c0_g1_i1.p1  ORF type:complete len:401 (+),score=90.35 TRINITY_DN80303_c0_g1_i1:98-1300(+)
MMDMLSKAMGSLSSPSSPKTKTPPAMVMDASCLSEEEKSLPPFFVEILASLWPQKDRLGGLRHFPERPSLTHKVKREDFTSSYSDFEYVYMTVLGFARLHTLAEEIASQNNGQAFTRNPGVQLLERECGMTMHGDREGANSILRSAPGALLEAFQAARSSPGGVIDFFRKAFDRTADPCLEGRSSRLMEYTEAMHRASKGPATAAPWEDISLQPLGTTATPQQVVGEHLRVFCNECTWNWARQRGISYEEAKAARLGGDAAVAANFAELYNAGSFLKAMQSRGVAVQSDSVVWEAQVDNGSFAPYDPKASRAIEQAMQAGKTQVELRLGPRGWTYIIDIANNLQRNPKTRKDRPIRRVAATSAAPKPPAGSMRLSHQDMCESIEFYVDMHTLPPEPALSL